jgi:hypothetical protein
MDKKLDSQNQKRLFCLFDASVIAAYYCPLFTRSPKVTERARILIEAVRSRKRSHFFYIPNFCIAEVFSVFMKYAFSNWNRHLRKGRIDRRVHNSLRDQFQEDIHNARLFYHYELSRYHVLAMNLIAPIDHHYKLSKRKKGGGDALPAGTFDHLILAMGIHLVKIHGNDNVIIITSDDRLSKVADKCKKDIPYSVKRRLCLDKASSLTGIDFKPENLPLVINLKTASRTKLKDIFGEWPLPSKKKYKRPYLAKMPLSKSNPK